MVLVKFVISMINYIQHLYHFYFIIIFKRTKDLNIKCITAKISEDNMGDYTILEWRNDFFKQDTESIKHKLKVWAFYLQ